MAGISSKAAGGVINKKGYNGNEIQNKEFSDGGGLEAYDFNARTYDPQIGRFIQVDPMMDEGGQESWSPYHFSYNNPVRFNDPDGKFPVPVLLPFIIEGGKAIIALYIAYKTTEAAKPLIDNVVRKIEDKGSTEKKSQPPPSNQHPEIKVDPKDKVDRELLNPPTKPGNAPTYKEDGKSVEIHHVGQKPVGPFKEMHPDEHRGKGNFKKNHSNTGQEPSKIDRKEFNKRVREYWQKEYEKRQAQEGAPQSA